jgi:hypothetical protein
MVMVQNSYGTKWFLVMVRNCNFVVRNGKLWYEMVMVRNDLLRITRNGAAAEIFPHNCNFVPYVFCTITISYHNLPFRTITRNHFVPYVFCTITICSIYVHVQCSYSLHHSSMSTTHLLLRRIDN